LIRASDPLQQPGEHHETQGIEREDRFHRRRLLPHGRHIVHPEGHPEHSPQDIIGYAANARIFTSLFERCEDPETAVSAILVSGPNGSGKTFQLEAYAAQSGRVVIELANIRGSYFGETEKFFELLPWHLVWQRAAAICQNGPRKRRKERAIATSFRDCRD